MKNTKRKLGISLITLLLSVFMLLGSTYAWFTDTASNTGNRIQAGELKIDLLMDKNHDGTYTSIKDSVGDIFKEANIAKDSNLSLWEPGKTQVVFLAIENSGSLACKYNTYINVTDEGLVGSLEYALFDGGTYETYTALGKSNWSDLKAVASKTDDVKAGSIVINTGFLDEISNNDEQNERDYVALAVHMKEDAGNDYQGKDIIIDVAIVATQASAELDGFDSYTYDSTAEFDEPVMPVHISAQKSFTKENITGSSTVVLESDNEVTATLTSNSAIDLINDIIDTNNQGSASETELLLKLNIDTSDSSESSVTYDIAMTGVVSTTKDGVKTVSEEKKLSSITDVVEIAVYVDKGLDNVTVKHSGVAMTEATTKADQTYSYNKTTGLLTIYTKSFSPFEINFEYELYVVDNDGYSYRTSLLGFADLVNNGKLEDGCKAYLLKDVDLSDAEWTPIGNWKYPFHGEFYGQDNTITGLSADESSFNDEGVVLSEGHVTGQGVVFGFFGIVGNGDVTIKNVDFTDVDIEDPNAQNVGTLIGYIPSTDNYTDTDPDKGGYYAPGKWTGIEDVGKVKVLIENVNVDGIIDVKAHVGGFIGKTYSEDTVKINNCSTSMKLTSHNTGSLACFVGINKGNLIISNSKINDGAALTYTHVDGDLGGPQICDYCYDNNGVGTSTITKVTGSPTIVVPDNTEFTNFTSYSKQTITLTNCIATHIYNYGNIIIDGGTFADSITNYEDGILTINNGRFNGTLTNKDDLTINGGTFNSTLTNNDDLTINGGTFNSTLTNKGTLIANGGTFADSITNYEDGILTINSDTFESTGSISNKGDLTIINGTFNGTLTNKDDLTINGGTFNSTLTNKGTLIANGGTFTNKLSSDEGTSLTIDGGSFTNIETKAVGATIANANVSGTIKAYAGGDLTINSGNFTSEAEYSLDVFGTLQINGGNFTYNKKLVRVRAGGTFNGVKNDTQSSKTYEWGLVN